MNANDGGGTVQGIHWTSWTATGAIGEGPQGTVPTEVTLSSPVDGRFTRIGETSNGQVVVQAYPDNDWPSGASPADGGLHQADARGAVRRLAGGTVERPAGLGGPGVGDRFR